MRQINDAHVAEPGLAVVEVAFSEPGSMVCLSAGSGAAAGSRSSSGCRLGLMRRA
ncbi:DUF6207 family protein [Streptomyces sp. NPDC059340]|uniref:DUF6207 family protein n=1 Tax=Streptomyces sp. NPDC059340 TaxID=3346806 RepID=UPI00368C42F5